MVVTLTGSLMVVPWVFLMVLSHMAKADGYMLRVFFDLHRFGLLSFCPRAFHFWFHSTSLLGAFICEVVGGDLEACFCCCVLLSF